MESGHSFVDVSRVFAEYGGRASLLNKLTGKAAVSHSVLRDVSFQLNQGDQVTLFGAEGTGKSTLLRLLSGVLAPSRGSILVNGKVPAQVQRLAAGYISPEESEPDGDSVQAVLQAFGETHGLTSLPARIGELSEPLGLANILHRPAATLSTAERLRVNFARAALADAPLLLLDDVADILGASTVTTLLNSLFAHRTAIVATRNPGTAEQLDLPVMLLHDATLVHSGTLDHIAAAVACPRVLDAWIEGLRYDVLRKLKGHSGVVSVRLLPTTQFSGQKLRITLHSSRFLPSIYDLLSRTPLVRVQEIPPSLSEIMQKL